MLTDYDISKHAGEEIELKCESLEKFVNFIWARKSDGRWEKIFKSFDNGFQRNWGSIYRLNGSNLVTNSLTEDLSGEYKCSNTDKVQTVSEISLKVLGPCPTSVCPDFEETPCTCPTIPTFPSTESLTTKIEISTNRPQKENTTAIPNEKDFRVECDKNCLDHDLLLCQREKWILKCGKADLACNLTSFQMEQLSSPPNQTWQTWQTWLHLSIHGVSLLVIVALLIYIYHLKSMINHINLTSIVKESYEVPILSADIDPHKYSSHGNTYDFIADVRPKGGEYDKYLELKSARDYELPPIPDYLEVLNN